MPAQHLSHFFKRNLYKSFLCVFGSVFFVNLLNILHAGAYGRNQKEIVKSRVALECDEKLDIPKHRVYRNTIPERTY